MSRDMRRVVIRTVPSHPDYDPTGRQLATSTQRGKASRSALGRSGRMHRENRPSHPSGSAGHFRESSNRYADRNTPGPLRCLGSTEPDKTRLSCNLHPPCYPLGKKSTLCRAGRTRTPFSARGGKGGKRAALDEPRRDPPGATPRDPPRAAKCGQQHPLPFGRG